MNVCVNSAGVVHSGITGSYTDFFKKGKKKAKKGKLLARLWTHPVRTSYSSPPHFTADLHFGKVELLSEMKLSLYFHSVYNCVEFVRLSRREN